MKLRYEINMIIVADDDMSIRTKIDSALCEYGIFVEEMDIFPAYNDEQ